MHVPTVEEETARDLVRSREDTRQDLMGARHRLSKLLLRHGFVYSDGAAWTGIHMPERELHGSPPRWRGARPGVTQRCHVDGITPALAGSTRASETANRNGSEHPRVGGEHTPQAVTWNIEDGSPPRWRGAPEYGRSSGAVRRITPALAGSTSVVVFRLR